MTVPPGIAPRLQEDAPSASIAAATPARDLARTTLGVASLGAMIVAAVWVLKPFLAAIVWGTMIVVATWPILMALQRRLGGRRGLAVTVMTVVLLLTLILPLAVAIFAVVVNIDAISGWITSVGSRGLPAPPDWLDSVPLVGAKIAAKWREFAAHPEQISATIAPYARSIAGLVVVMVGNVAVLLVQFLLIVGVSALLYAQGEAAADLMRRFAVRIAGARGERSVRLAGQAIRSVAMGIVVTALVQAVVAGAGLAISGVPFAAVLSAVILLLCIVQLGPILVLIPAVVWLYWSGDTVWGTVLLVWSLVVSVMDNVLRPILIRKGADLPLPLIIGGVIGGLISFGVVGLFIGPVVLAVTYTLLVDWVHDGDPRGASVPR